MTSSARAGLAVRGGLEPRRGAVSSSSLLYGTLVLAERRSGYIIMLIGGLFALGMPVIHMVLARTVVANEVARARGDYFFVWTLLALGVTGLFAFVLAARGLRSRLWSQPR